MYSATESMCEESVKEYVQQSAEGVAGQTAAHELVVAPSAAESGADAAEAAGVDAAEGAAAGAEEHL